MGEDINNPLAKRNPFYRESWDKETWDLTEDRIPDLKKLFGLTEEAIRKIGSNNGEYVAFKAIKSGLAKMSFGILIYTQKWIEQHPGYGKG